MQQPVKHHSCTPAESHVHAQTQRTHARTRRLCLPNDFCVGIMFWKIWGTIKRGENDNLQETKQALVIRLIWAEGPTEFSTNHRVHLLLLLLLSSSSSLVSLLPTPHPLFQPFILYVFISPLGILPLALSLSFFSLKESEAEITEFYLRLGYLHFKHSKDSLITRLLSVCVRECVH